MTLKIDKIIRSKRKTIALQVTDDATLIVRAPFDVSEETIKKSCHKTHKVDRKKRKMKCSPETHILPKKRVCKWRGISLSWKIIPIVHS